MHGNLFSFLNIMIGYLLFQLELTKGQRAWVSWTTLIGLLMPVGILLELVFGAPPYFVLVGAISMTAGIFFLGLFVLKSKLVLVKR